MDETTLLWAGKFLTLLKMNLSEDDFGTLIYLIRKAQKNMLKKRWSASSAQIVDELSNGLNKNLKE